MRRVCVCAHPRNRLRQNRFSPARKVRVDVGALVSALSIFLLKTYDHEPVSPGSRIINDVTSNRDVFYKHHKRSYGNARERDANSNDFYIRFAAVPRSIIEDIEIDNYEMPTIRCKSDGLHLQF